MFRKTTSYEISEQIENYILKGYIIMENMENDDESIFNTFQYVVTNILKRHPYISSNAFNKKCEESMPYGKFFITLNPVTKEFDEKRREHISFGLIRFFNTSGTPRNLFGSSIKHQNTVTMEVCHAYETRNIHKDHQIEDGIIARVEMSRSQFADLITSIGHFSGSPCTIRFTEMNGNMEYEYPKSVNKKLEAKKEFSSKIENAGNSVKECIDDIQKIFDNKKTLNKGDRAEILNKLNRIYNDISCNASYMTECFTEQMEKTIHEAKGEVEAYIDEKIRNNAMISKKENNFLLDDFSDDVVN